MTGMTRTSDRFRKNAADTRLHDNIARTTFARVYPVIADQILERTGINHGTCLDIGSGSGLLAIAVALLSDLRVTALDNSPEILELAHRNIRDRCMEGLVVPALGDVHAIPAADAAFNLVISRGSFHSWRDLPVAFREIHRVLKPWGMAYIGGGYGSARIRDEILAGRKNGGTVKDPHSTDWNIQPKMESSRILESVERAGIQNYQIIDDDSGFWVIIRKTDYHRYNNCHEREIPVYPKQVPVFHHGFFFHQ